MNKKIILIFFPVVTFLLALLFTSGRSLAHHPDSNISSTPDFDSSKLKLANTINTIEVFQNQSDLLKNIKNIIPDINTGGIGIGTTLPSLNLLNTENLSTSDLPGALKAIAVLGINLTLIVIQTVAAVLKALLPFLSG